MRDPTDLRSLEQDEQANALTQQTARQKEIDDFKWLLGHKQGRRIAWRILEQAGVYRQTFTGNSESFFLEGKRSIGLFVLAEVMDASVDAFTLMTKENHGR